MRPQHYIIPCVILLLLAPFAVRAERLPVRIYTSADGLGSSFVDSIARDSYGFLWLSTRDGLSRFDGSRFITYQVGDENSPPGIEAVFETSKGVYWITAASGTYRFKPDDNAQSPQLIDSSTSARPNLNARLVSDLTGTFYEDRSGKLWFCADALYLVEENGAETSFRKVEFDLPGKYAGGGAS